MLINNLQKIKELAQESIDELEPIVTPYYSEGDMILTNKERKTLFTSSMVAVFLANIIDHIDGGIDDVCSDLDDLLK